MCIYNSIIQAIHIVEKPVGIKSSIWLLVKVTQKTIAEEKGNLVFID